MRAHCFRAFLPLFIAAVACSAPPPLRTTDGPPSDSADAKGNVDLSPVPAPAGIVAKGRAKNLGATMRVVGALIGAPGDTVEGAGRGLLGQLLARGVRLEIDPAFTEQVALDAPVDFAVLVSDRMDVHFAVSVGLANADAARAAAGPNVAEVGPGVWSVGGEKAKASCAIMVAAGAAPARLVCGMNEGDIETLGPYLTRTVSIEPPPAQDLVAEIDVAAIDARFGSLARKLLPGLPTIAAKKYGTGNATYDKAIEEAARFVATDVPLILEDMKKVRVEGRVDPVHGIDLELKAELKPGAKSWLARTALSGASNRVPELLWKGPADASGAVFGTIVDPAAFGDITKSLKGMVSGALEAAKIGNDVERKKVADLLDLPLAKGATFAGLGGFGRLTKATEPKNEKERQQRHFDRLMGWYMIGTNQKADAWAKWLKDASTAFNQPGVQKALKKELGKNESVSVTTAAAPKELGKGAFQLNVSFTSRVEKEKAEGTLMMLLMPDGESSWIALGFDRTELVERLLRVRDAKGGLKDRKDLTALNEAGTNGGAFLTLQSFRSSVYAMMLMQAAQQKGAKPEELASMALNATDEVFAALPQKGLSPMFLRTSVQSGSTLMLDIEMRKPVLDDASALVKMFTPQRR